jgi:DNA-binding winged helix-turn-helix (wHTH) protein/Tol biopolymer transport system component
VASIPNGNLTEVVRFGVYEVDPRAGELRRNGVKVKIQEQPYQVLALLLERPGEVVTREELKRRLWPADTFVDFDHSLNAAIKRLRDALRDSADNPRFVETLARRGYRFLAPVAGSLPSPLSLAPQLPQIASRRRNRARWIAAIIVLAGACISVGFHIGSRAARAEVPNEAKLTANSPDVPVYRAAISPDARLLAYTDPRGLFLREIAREDSHQLWLPPGLKPNVVSWFPDGNHLLVGGIQSEGEEPSLWNVSILGGPSRKVSDETDSGVVSPDGNKIAALRGNGKVNSSELWLMNSDGSQSQKLLDISGYSNALTWSPSGTRLAYMKASYWPGYKEDVQIETVDLTTGKTSTALSDDKIGGGLVWSRDGRLFFSRTEENSYIKSDIWSLRVDERTGEARGNIARLTNSPDWKPRPEVSADGKKMVFLRNNIAPTVYLAQVEPKTNALDQVQRLTLDESVSRPYEWTPDGAALLYISNRDGEFHIFRQRLGAASPELVVDGHDNPYILRLNPDATQIMYMSDASRAGRNGTSPRERTGLDREKARLMAAPISGGVGKLILEADGMSNFQCARAPATFCLFSRFTKDALAFVQFDSATGEMKDFFQANDSGWQNYNWTLSPDGKVVALCKEGRVSLDTTVRLIPTDGGPERNIHLNEWVSISAIDWAADGKSFWASATLRGENHALVNIDLRGDIKPVLQGGKPYIGWGIQSRDGKHLAIWQATGGSNVWMLESF